MKNPNIILTDEGLFVIDAPDEPPMKLGIPDKEYSELWDNYYEGLNQAIKEGVKFKDVVKREVPHTEDYYAIQIGNTPIMTLQKDKLYDIPEGYKIRYEFINPCIKAKKCLIADVDNKNNCAQLHGNECQKIYSVAVLEPLTKQKPEKLTRAITEKMMEVNESKQLTPNATVMTEKQLTPLAELIEKVEQELLNISHCLKLSENNDEKSAYAFCLDRIIGVKLKAQSLLPKEKQKTIDDWTQGWNDRGNDDGDFSQHSDGEQYFNQTYKQ